MSSPSAREIITVNVGGCGINLGQSSLEQLCAEQGIGQNGEKEYKTQHDESVSISFKEASNGKYYARSLFADLDPYSLSITKNIYKYSGIIRKGNCIGGRTDHHKGVFAAGHYTIGKEIIDKFSERMRLMVEECDNIQGFIFNHSIAGGCGSGFGALCLERLAVDYRKKCKFGFSAFPDDRRMMTPCEAYNCLLSCHWLLDHLEVCLFLDNHKLF